MDPKGDRLRKIQMGMLKLPESVLKSNNIVLTGESPKPGGGCLEGGARPRPIPVVGSKDKSVGDAKPLIIGNDGTPKMMDASGIPLPNDADIPLPPNLVPETDIPLPSPLSSENIPLPKDSDIPLPPDDLIPLPADKPLLKKKVSLSRLEPTGDELLCRSCEMKFAKQVDYDTHLQTESHQQAIEADLKEGRSHGIGLLIPRQNKKSPSHDVKSGHVSFSFKKNIGCRITNAQPFHQQRNERTVSPEIKILKAEDESLIDKMDTNDVVAGQIGAAEKVLSSMKGMDGQENKLLCSFVKVQSKDDSGRVLDWPKEMIQYTQTEPKITYSCNPLCFDFSQLFGNKLKKSPVQGSLNTSGIEGYEGGKEVTGLSDSDVKKGDNNTVSKGDEEKKKSHKKKKKKKHKKHKDKTDEKEIKEGENKEINTENKVLGDESKEGVVSKQDVGEGESTTVKKKKKRKNKKKEKDTPKEEEEKDKGDDTVEKEKKKHKKNKKRKHQSEVEDESKTGEEEKKNKKRKKSKKSKKRKRKHQSDKENEKSEVEEDLEKKIEKNGENSDTSADETDAEKDKDGKKKKKKRKKNKKKDGGVASSDDETEKTVDKPDDSEKVNMYNGNIITVKKKLGHDSETENEKIVAKLLAMKSAKPSVVPNVIPIGNPITPAPVKKLIEDVTDKKVQMERKRINSESNISDSTPSNVKKSKVTPKTVSGLKDNITPIATVAIANVKVEKDDSWVKIENQTTDNVKSKWDTSDSDMENALDETVKTKKKKENPVKKVQRKIALANTAKKELISQQPKILVRKDITDIKKTINPSLSQRSNKSNVSVGSTKKTPASVKVNKKARSPASSRSSRSRSRSYRRSYSRSSSRSRSNSYSSTSSYSSGYSHSRHRKRKRSSSRSYSRSSRSRSRSYHRGRGRSSSYSSSYSRSYSSSRSRSRSHRRRRRRRSYTRSRTYSSSSYSSRSRSRSRSYRRKSRRKVHRRTKPTKPKPVPVITTEKEVTVKAKSAVEKETLKEPNVDPSNIPLPDLSGKKEDEKSEEKLAKLKDKKPRTDVGQTVAKLVESLPSDIPLPFSENSVNTVSSDALPSSPPTTATKECESGFIGPKLPNSNMAPPPPPPPGHLRFPNYGPMGPPRPGYHPNHWDHWGGPGPWDGPGHWDGPGPGPRPYRGMRPPFDQRMSGPFDPRMRRPPPFMNRHGPMHMGPRYPGPHGPPHEYDYEYDYPQEYDTQFTEDEPPKKESPPPLPPPKVPSPKPPPPEKKEKEKESKEPEQNPNIVIPPEQAEQYKHLQKQAAKHARRQRRRQQKKELGEPEEDSTSSESEPEQQEEQESEIVEEEQQFILEEMQPQVIGVPQQVVLTQQPQPASSPAGFVVAVSNGQQIILQKQPQVIQAGIPVQAGQPMILSQNAMLAAAASGAQPAHIVQHVPAGLQTIPTGQMLTQAHIPQGIQVIHSSPSIQQIQQLQQIQQIQQAHQIQQIQQAHAVQAHNQAVAAAHAAQHTGPIVVGNQILVPRFGVRPAI